MHIKDYLGNKGQICFECFECFIYQEFSTQIPQIMQICFLWKELCCPLLSMLFPLIFKTTITDTFFVLNVLSVLFIKNLARRFRRFCRFYFSFLLCQHDLFAPQTVRTASVLRLTYAAHADEALLSPFRRTRIARMVTDDYLQNIRVTI